MLEHILKGLDMTREEIHIYLELLESDSTTAGKLSQKIGMPRATLYGTLQRLTDKGVIYKSVQYGVRRFQAEPPEKLSQLYDKKIKDLEWQHQQFRDCIPALNKKLSSDFLSPRFEFFEGLKSVKYAIQDFLSYENIESLNFWAGHHMVDLLSQEHFFYTNKRRIQNNISQKLLVPSNQEFTVKRYPFAGSGEIFKRELRMTPSFVTSTMSYWVYQNKVLFFSSRKEAYAYMIESKDMANMMRTHFEAIWKLSKPYIMKEREADIFLDFLKSKKPVI